MSNTSNYWIPAGDLSEGQALLLAVPSKAKPDPQVYPMLLAEKLQDLIDQDEKEAQSALEMSQEHLPELYQIAQDQPPKWWGTSLTNSDSMHSLLSHLDWSKPGKVQPLPQQDSLRSQLEQLP